MTSPILQIVAGIVFAAIGGIEWRRGVNAWSMLLVAMGTALLLVGTMRLVRSAGRWR